MMKYKLSASPATMRGTLATIVLTAACSATWALPTFTFNPSAIDSSITGGPVTADNFNVSGYATVTRNSTGTSFTEQGYLAINSLTLNKVAVPSGIDSTFGLYVRFTGSGTSTAGATTGAFTSLNYDLYGYKGGPATFSTSAAGTEINVPGSGPSVLLGSGSLLPGSPNSVGTFGSGPFGQTGAYAALSTTFTPTTVGSSFFTSPKPFYPAANISFIDTAITPTASGFLTTQGGGTVNFATAVPEPATYAMLLAGLGAVGFVAKRRKG